MQDLPTDGLVTSQNVLGLELNAADCPPLVLYDPNKKVLGVGHIGRHGAALDLGPKMLEGMKKIHGSPRSKVIAYFGPAIAQVSYVMPRVDGHLHKPEWRQFIDKVPGGYAVDVVGYAAQRLLEHGVAAKNIHQSDVDVFADPDSFSLTAHKQLKRPDGRNGFMAALAV